MSNQIKQRAYTKLILAIFAWAGVYQSANYLVKFLDPFSSAFIRYFIAALILVIIFRLKRGKFINLEQFKDNWLLLLSLGIVGIGFYNLAFFSAEKYLSANMVVIIFSFSPCLTAFLASLVFKQKIGKAAYLGMLIALAGAIGVINFSNPHCGHYFCRNILTQLSRGQIYAILLCFLAAAYSLMNRQASQRQIDSLTITTFSAFFGMLVLLGSAITLGNLSQILHQSLIFWLVMFYTSVFGSVIAYFWFSEAISELGVAKVAVFLNGIPFATILIGIILFAEPVSLPEIICGLVIIAGVLLTNFTLKALKK